MHEAPRSPNSINMHNNKYMLTLKRETLYSSQLCRRRIHSCVKLECIFFGTVWRWDPDAQGNGMPVSQFIAGQVSGLYAPSQTDIECAFSQVVLRQQVSIGCPPAAKKQASGCNRRDQAHSGEAK
jgi:hypothetical protein